MKKILTDGFAVGKNPQIAELAQRVITDQREILKDPYWTKLLSCPNVYGRECGLHVYGNGDLNEHTQPRDQKAKFEFTKKAYEIIKSKHLPPFLGQHIESMATLYELNVKQMKEVLAVLDEESQWKFGLLSKFNIALTQDLHVLRVAVYFEPNDNGELAKAHCDQSMVTCVNATTHPGLYLSIDGSSIPFHSSENQQLYFGGMKGSLETGGGRDVRINCHGTAPILATTGGVLCAVEHWAEQPEGLAPGEYRGTAVFFGHSVRTIKPLSQKEIEAISILK